MKVYHLTGCIIENKKVVIAVSLPKPENGNNYFIYRVHRARKNEIVIHFKDFLDVTLTDSSNFETFVIDLTIKDQTIQIDEFDFSKNIRVLLVHSNSNSLPKSALEYFEDEDSCPIVNERVGRGTIRS